MNKLAKKSRKFLQEYWPYFLIFIAIGNGIVLLIVEQLYKSGILSVNYSSYIATTVAGIILLVMIIGYSRSIITIVKQEKNLKSRD